MLVSSLQKGHTMKKLVISSLLLAALSSAQAAEVLVVLSDANHLDLRDGKVFQTGFYLNELMQPVKRLLDAGHTVTFATPQGQAPTLDASSDTDAYFGGDAAAHAAHKALLEQLALTVPGRSPVISLQRVAQIGYGHYAAVLVPGGHAPMQDLLKDASLGALLRQFHADGKPTALLCHGPIALLSALPQAAQFTAALEAGRTPAKPAGWIYSGYRMTVISNQEELAAQAALKGGLMKFYPQSGLQAAGAQYVRNQAPWTSNVVVDRELITGQNPASAPALAEQLLRALR